VLEKWVESVKSHNMQFVTEAGQTIPGFDLKTKSGKREIRDTMAAYLIAIVGLPTAGAMGYLLAMMIGVLDVIVPNPLLDCQLAPDAAAAKLLRLGSTHLPGLFLSCANAMPLCLA
jgi:hypothetical protein